MKLNEKETQYLITATTCEACGSKMIAKIINGTPTEQDKIDIEEMQCYNCTTTRLFAKNSNGIFEEVEESDSEYGWRIK